MLWETLRPRAFAGYSLGPQLEIVVLILLKPARHVSTRFLISHTDGLIETLVSISLGSFATISQEGLDYESVVNSTSSEPLGILQIDRFIAGGIFAFSTISHHAVGSKAINPSDGWRTIPKSSRGLRVGIRTGLSWVSFAGLVECGPDV